MQAFTTSQSPRGLVKTQIAGPFPQDYDSVGWGLEAEHSEKSPGDVTAAGPGTTPGGPLVQSNLLLGLLSSLWLE